MKMYWSATSPFARKCLVAAHELGLRERIELIASAPHPVTRDAALVAKNPLGQVPTLVTDDGGVLYDSRVVAEYLDAVAGGGRLLPREGAARFGVLTEQSLADGMLNAAVLVRYENAARPEALRWADWSKGQLEKVICGLDAVEARAAAFGDRVDLGTIAFGCALGYLDFRYADLGWRAARPNAAAWFKRFDARPSMVATRPPAA
jgi:glutathione S-transferase